MVTAKAETGLMAHTVAMTTALEISEPLITIPWIRRIEEHASWPALSKLLVTMNAAISLKKFTVRDLLELAEGQVFETISSDTDDVPLKVGDVQLSWSEFEVLDQKIAVRLTRLA